MPLILPPIVEPLTRKHDRERFDCGIPVLNEYLQRQASQDTRRGISRVYVARPRGSMVIHGYYTLSATSIGKENLPDTEAKRLPHYPIPAALLGRLAVDRNHQGQMLGKYLLFDAFHRVLQAAETLAVYALIVDSKNENAQAFYLRHGFLRFPNTPSCLFIPVETLRRAAE